MRTKLGGLWKGARLVSAPKSVLEKTLRHCSSRLGTVDIGTRVMLSPTADENFGRPDGELAWLISPASSLSSIMAC